MIRKLCAPLLSVALLIAGCTGAPKGLTPVTGFVYVVPDNNQTPDKRDELQV